MDAYGYAGSILRVDLTSGEVQKEDLDLSLVKRFVGDFGIGAKLAYDLMKPGIAPLSQDNVIIIGAGPLVGTAAPEAARCHVYAKWLRLSAPCASGGGMGFPIGLKNAGYDELIISGRANNPVYLKVSDEDVEIYDARDLWGNDIFKVTDELWERHGRAYGVICIGQAGENMSEISLALIDKSSTLGRYGLGAVMGSKNLKAIIAGGKKGVTVADRSRFRRLITQVIEDYKNWPVREEVVRQGIAAYQFNELLSGGALMNGHTEQPSLDYCRETFGPEPYFEKLNHWVTSCPACLIGCRLIEEVREGKYKGLRTHMSNFLWLSGATLGLQSIEEYVKLKDVLQRNGIDELEFACEASLLMHLCEQGTIPKDACEGLAGGSDYIRLAEKTAIRQGIGDALADGLRGLSKRFGSEWENWGLYVKGSSLFFDARIIGLNLSRVDEITSPMGINAKGGMITPPKYIPDQGKDVYDKFADRAAIPREVMDRIYDTPFKINMARLVRHTQDYYAAMSCLGLCIRNEANMFYSMERMANLYSAATGIEMDKYDLKRAGERAWNMAKVLTVREGFSRKDDSFPVRWFESVKCNGEEFRLMDALKTRTLTADDLEKALNEYYDERGWDIEKGIPTRKKLMELELADVAQDLERDRWLA